MWLVLLLVFGQASVGNERFDQKQYADAANAYERIPAAQRDAESTTASAFPIT
jgi:hypothetical protein